MVLGRAVFCGNCCFSSVVLSDDASNLYIFMCTFCSYVVFNVLFNYYCSTSVPSVRYFVWVIRVIYIVVWYCYVASVGEMGF